MPFGPEPELLVEFRRALSTVQVDVEELAGPQAWATAWWKDSTDMVRGRIGSHPRSPATPRADEGQGVADRREEQVAMGFVGPGLDGDVRSYRRSRAKREVADRRGVTIERGTHIPGRIRTRPPPVLPRDEHPRLRAQPRGRQASRPGQGEPTNLGVVSGKARFSKTERRTGCCRHGGHHPCGRQGPLRSAARGVAFGGRGSLGYQVCRGNSPVGGASASGAPPRRGPAVDGPVAEGSRPRFRPSTARRLEWSSGTEPVPLGHGGVLLARAVWTVERTGSSPRTAAAPPTGAIVAAAPAGAPGPDPHPSGPGDDFRTGRSHRRRAIVVWAPPSTPLGEP